MKTKKNVSAVESSAKKPVDQPEPFTPGVTKAMVRQRAFELYRDKLQHGKLTLEDWVLAEKDIANELQAEGRYQHPATPFHPEGR